MAEPVAEFWSEHGPDVETVATDAAEQLLAEVGETRVVIEQEPAEPQVEAAGFEPAAPPVPMPELVTPSPRVLDYFSHPLPELLPGIQPSQPEPHPRPTVQPAETPPARPAETPYNLAHSLEQRLRPGGKAAA